MNNTEIEHDDFRLVVGEVGNEQGHVIETEAHTEAAARAALAAELAPYDGDGWGYVEVMTEGGWYRLDGGAP